MTEMKPSYSAAIFDGPNLPLRLARATPDDLRDGECLVRIDCCTLCGSDLHTINGDRVEPTPSILGHEAVGHVIAVEGGPTDLRDRTIRVGDRVTWGVIVSCGCCDRCIAGLSQKCRQLFKYGHQTNHGDGRFSGSLAEAILLRRRSAILIVDESIPDDVIAPANCATATIAAALRKIGSVQGDDVVVLGSGMLGITAVAMARFQGARRIAIIEPDPRRQELAKDFGADDVFGSATDAADNDQLKSPDGYAVVIEACGAASAQWAAIELADFGGRIALVGAVKPLGTPSWCPERIVRRCLSLFGVHNYQAVDLVNAVEFLTVTANDLPWLSLVGSSYALTQVNEAIEDARQSTSPRIAVRP